MQRCYAGLIDHLKIPFQFQLPMTIDFGEMQQ